MRKVEDLQEYQDVQFLTSKIRNMDDIDKSILISNIIDQVCWYGPVTREWMEEELKFKGGLKVHG